MSDDINPTPFTEFLTKQSRGKTLVELSEGLHELVARVMDTGKPGVLTLKVKVEVMKGSDDTVTVSDEITLKLPEHDRPASVWFQDADGAITRNDPAQQLTFPAHITVDEDGVIHEKEHS